MDVFRAQIICTACNDNVCISNTDLGINGLDGTGFNSFTNLYVADIEVGMCRFSVD